MLYNHEGDFHSIEFRIGDLNIITGASGTGKTALIRITEYCLGSKDCRIPEGPPVDDVDWVGLKLQLKNGQAFIARKIPIEGNKTSEDIFYKVQPEVEIPSHSELEKICNLEVLKALLTQLCGIDDNIEKSSTGKKITAQIRHALFYNFQEQTELTTNDFLFHKQNSPAVHDMKLTLPYFLGAYGDDLMKKINELKAKNKKLTLLRRKQSEFEAVKGSDISLAKNLLLEAQNIGISTFEIIPNTWEDCIKLLQEIRDLPLEYSESFVDTNDSFDRLMNEYNALIVELSSIRREIKSIEDLKTYQSGFSNETKSQLLKIKSIELFDDEENSSIQCPICSSEITNKEIPTLMDLKNSSKQLESRIRSVEENSPQMQKVLEDLKIKRQELELKTKENRSFRRKIQDSNIRLKKIKENSEKKIYLRGQIDLYLDSISYLAEDVDLQSEIDKITNRISDLKEETHPEKYNERMKKILDEINENMNGWANSLELQHKGRPLFFDPKKLTILVDLEKGLRDMVKIGSGATHRGYHILAHLAIHKLFVDHNRPVPRFLFIDEPSQSNFLSENATEEEKKRESKAVLDIYKLLFRFIKDMEPDFQIIVTDHADFSDEFFKDSLIDTWGPNNALVPYKWIKKDN